MANYVILGVEGDPSVYVVDLVKHTVASMDRSLVALADSNADGQRSPAIKGVNLAIAATARSDAASLYMSPAT